MIYVANDSGSKEFAPAIRKRINTAVKVMEMESGDFAFKGKGPHGPVLVGIERKAIGDMLSSMRAKRYAGFQMRNMNRDYDVCYLLVEGLWRPSNDGLLEVPIRNAAGKTKWIPYRLSMSTKLRAHSTPYMYSELDKHLCSVENIKNVILLRSTSKMETIWQVINRHQWWQKEWDEHNSADPIKLQAEITFAHITECRRFATGLPGVGWKKSAELAAVFGTIEQAVNASLKELTKVVGTALASKLYEHMRTYK